MLRLNWAYALLSLAVVPLMIVATLWFSGQARTAFRRTRKEIGNVNAELQESISGVREAQAFSREEANIESFRVSNAANRDANMQRRGLYFCAGADAGGAGLRGHGPRRRRRRHAAAAGPAPRRARSSPSA